MSRRMRVIFTLKSLASDGAVDVLTEFLTDPSVLLAHEVAYCLGQMRNPRAIPSLIDTLQNESLHPMVRHEAAEALGAIGGDNAERILKQFEAHPVLEVRHTCQIALGLIQWKKKNPDSADANASNSNFKSVDPAPPSGPDTPLPILKSTLLDHTLPLFDRYRSLFALRNMATPEAIKVLSEALHDKDSGAVFTHEVAYVLGQLQDKLAVEVLSNALKDESLNCMVRHEAAEALGNIAEEETVQLLKQYAKDQEEAVKSSCIVALDILEYVSSDQFQYANALYNLACFLMASFRAIFIAKSNIISSDPPGIA